MEIILKDITFNEYKSGVQLFHPIQKIGQKIRTPLIFFILFVVLFVWLSLQTTLSFIQMWLILLPLILMFYYFLFKIFIQPFIEFKRTVFYHSEKTYQFTEEAITLIMDNKHTKINFPVFSKHLDTLIAFYQNDRLHILPSRYFDPVDWQTLQQYFR